MRTAAIIPAAGSGTRINAGIPKQFLPLGGRPMLARTLEALDRVDGIEVFFLALAPGEFDCYSAEIAPGLRLRKEVVIVEGGPSRQASVQNGLSKAGGYDIMLIHDAARPFITIETAEAIISEAGRHGAACAAIPVTDTIKKADGSGFISSTVPREGLWAVQTPQAFRRELILRAHARAAQDGFTGTDDASLAERLGERVKIVESSPLNIKITTMEDFIFAESIIRELGL